MADLTLYPDAPNNDDGDVGEAASAAAKMVLDRTAIDSNQAWQTAYKNVVKAVGHRYKKYARRQCFRHWMAYRGLGRVEALPGLH